MRCALVPRPARPRVRGALLRIGGAAVALAGLAGDAPADVNRGTAPSERALSASRDIATFEWALGPAAQVSLGDEVQVRGRLRLAALAAFENVDGYSPLPEDLARWYLTADWRFDLPWSLELTAGAGVERAYTLQPTPPAFAPGDIPFGAAGDWLALTLARRFVVEPAGSVRIAAGDRVFLNELPLTFGSRAASDYVADQLGEGLRHAPWMEAVFTWRGTAVTWFASGFGELLVPYDRSADVSGFGRVLLGVARGPIAPFVSFDVGSGKGLLVNRHELRLSVGLRRVW